MRIIVGNVHVKGLTRLDRVSHQLQRRVRMLYGSLIPLDPLNSARRIRVLKQ